MWDEVRAAMAAELATTHPEIAAALLAADLKDDEPVIPALRRIINIVAPNPGHPHLRLVK